MLELAVPASLHCAAPRTPENARRKRRHRHVVDSSDRRASGVRPGRFSDRARHRREAVGSLGANNADGVDHERATLECRGNGTQTQRRRARPQSTASQRATPAPTVRPAFTKRRGSLVPRRGASRDASPGRSNRIHRMKIARAERTGPCSGTPHQRVPSNQPSRRKMSPRDASWRATGTVAQRSGVSAATSKTCPAAVHDCARGSPPPLCEARYR